MDRGWHKAPPCASERSSDRSTERVRYAARRGHRRYTSEGHEDVANMAVGDAIREKREAILRIAAGHGATEVRLIGSVARGEARPDSDVDLLVTWSAGTSLLDQAALMLELESLLGGKSTSPAMAG